MNRSQECGELFAALAAAQAEYKPLVKNKKANYGMFADLSAIIEATSAALSKHGLCVSQNGSFSDGRVQTQTLLGHKSGQWIETSLSLKPRKDDEQGVAGAITYGRRYSLGPILGISAEDDDDGGSAVIDHSKKESSKKVQEAPTPPPGPYLFDMYKDEDSDELIKLLNKKEIDPAIHQDIAAKLHGKEFVIENIKKAKDEALAEMERG